MPDPPEESHFDSETIGRKPRLPFWFWPAIIIIIVYFIYAMITK